MARFAANDCPPVLGARMDSRVLDKIRKLLRMAEHQASNPNEAASAAAHAQRLMDEHNLSAAMLELDDETKAEDVVMADGADALDSFDRLRLWKARLSLAIAEANHCESIVRGVRGLPGRRLALIGRPSDIAAVRYIYAFVAGETDRLVERNCRHLGATWRNNYRHGVVDAVAERLAEQRRAFESEQRENAADAGRVNAALMRIESRSLQVAAFVARELPGAKTSEHKHAHDVAARAVGYVHGSRIRLGGSVGSLTSPAPALEGGCGKE